MKKRNDVEWLGGIFPLPTQVTGEGKPYRPMALFWMDQHRAILGSTAARPEEILDQVVDSLRTTIARPMLGPPRSPSRLRVASPELAEALRSVPGIEVVCAPTPELDEAIEILVEKLEGDESVPLSFLSTDADPDAVGGFFEATAALYRAKPWMVVPSDAFVTSVTIEDLGVRDAAISIIGQAGESFGFVLFSSLEDFEGFLDAAAAMEQGEEPSMPSHYLSLNFTRGADLSPALRKEIAQHRWQVAHANAHPWLMAIDEGLITRPPVARELTLFEAISRALVVFLKEKKALRKAWNSGVPVSRTIRVSTHAGEHDVTLLTPFVREKVHNHDLLAALAELEDAEDELDEDARADLEERLMDLFDASPEAKHLDTAEFCWQMMDLGARYLGLTIASIGPMDLREILFELFPRKVSVEASEAHAIIEELRTFYAFLKREMKLDQADACLRVLGGSATRKLEAELSDTTNFGLAKSFFAQGAKAGFDMTTQEGLDAFVLSVNERPGEYSRALPPLVDLPKRPKPATSKATKNKRKATRRARRKNR